MPQSAGVLEDESEGEEADSPAEEKEEAAAVVKFYADENDDAAVHFKDRLSLTKVSQPRTETPLYSIYVHTYICTLSLSSVATLSSPPLSRYHHSLVTTTLLLPRLSPHHHFLLTTTLF